MRLKLKNFLVLIILIYIPSVIYSSHHYYNKNKVLNKKNNSKYPIYLLHGEKDDVVPQSLSRKILKVFPNSNKEFIKIKNGDHSLSRVKDLKILSNYMNKIIDYCAKPSL